MSVVLLRRSIQNRKSRFLLKIESNQNRNFRAPPKRLCPLQHFAHSRCRARDEIQSHSAVPSVVIMDTAWSCMLFEIYFFLLVAYIYNRLLVLTS